jgi:hypothetical protein
VLWNAGAEKEIVRVTLAEGVIGELTFTPDGRFVPGADASGTHVWEDRQ